MRMFSGSEVAKTIGIDQRLLAQWINRRLVRPTKKVTGSGNKNEFTLTDIIRVGIMKQLADSGVNREQAAAIAFCPENDPVGAAFSQIINRVLESIGRAQKHKTGGGGILTTPVVEQCIVVFFRDADGNYSATPYYDATELFDLFSAPDEPVAVIRLSRLIKRVVEALGTE